MLSSNHVSSHAAGAVVLHQRQVQHSLAAEYQPQQIASYCVPDMLELQQDAMPKLVLPQTQQAVQLDHAVQLTLADESRAVQSLSSHTQQLMPHSPAPDSLVPPATCQPSTDILPETDYSSQAVASIMAGLKHGQRRVVVRMPPGTPVIRTAAAAAVAAAAKQKVLVLLSGADRMDAMQSALIEAGPSIRVAVAPGRDARVVLVDLAQFIAGPRMPLSMKYQGFKLAIVLEPVCTNPFLGPEPVQPAASTAAAASRGSAMPFMNEEQAAQGILHDLGFLDSAPGRNLLTVSGSFWKTLAGVPCSSHQHLAAEMTAKQAMEEGWLSPVRSVVMHTGVRLPWSGATVMPGSMQCQHLVSPTSTDIVLLTGGRDIIKDHNVGNTVASSSSSNVGNMLSTQLRNNMVADAYAQYAQWTKALVYAVDPVHARDLAIALNQRGISALTLHGDQSAGDKTAVLDAFTHGNDKVLVTTIALHDVHHLPCISCVIMAAPTLNKTTYSQWLLPGMLPHADKQQCVVVDMIDEWEGQQGSSGLASVSSGPHSATDATTVITCTDVLRCSMEMVQVAQPFTYAASTTTVSGSGNSVSAAAGALQAVPAENAAGQVSERTGKANPSRARKTLPMPDDDVCVGDLVWHAVQDGSWALALSNPVSLANPKKARILWLRRAKTGYIPELESKGTLQPLSPSSRAMKLQKARVSSPLWKLDT